MATVVMEQIGRLFINAQQLRQIPRFLESAFPKLPCTVMVSDVPWVFRESHIFTGYRPPDQNWRYYFLTLFQRHNESLNVWTHLLASLIILVKFQELSETVDFLRDPHAQPLFILLLAAFTYLGCSALAHLLSAKSELSHYTFYFLDYVGVAVYQYGSALGPLLLRHRTRMARSSATFFLASRGLPGLAVLYGLLLRQVRQPKLA